MAWMVDKLFKDDKLPGTLRAASCKSVQEFHKWVRQRDDYSRMFYREVRLSSHQPNPIPRYAHLPGSCTRSGTRMGSTAS